MNDVYVCKNCKKWSMEHVCDDINNPKGFCSKYKQRTLCNDECATGCENSVIKLFWLGVKEYIKDVDDEWCVLVTFIVLIVTGYALHGLVDAVQVGYEFIKSILFS